MTIRATIKRIFRIEAELLIAMVTIIGAFAVAYSKVNAQPGVDAAQDARLEAHLAEVKADKKEYEAQMRDMYGMIKEMKGQVDIIERRTRP